MYWDTMAKVNTAVPTQRESGGNVTSDAQIAAKKITAHFFGLTRCPPLNDPAQRRRLGGASIWNGSALQRKVLGIMAFPKSIPVSAPQVSTE